MALITNILNNSESNKTKMDLRACESDSNEQLCIDTNTISRQFSPFLQKCFHLGDSSKPDMTKKDIRSTKYFAVALRAL